MEPCPGYPLLLLLVMVDANVDTARTTKNPCNFGKSLHKDFFVLIYFLSLILTTYESKRAHPSYNSYLNVFTDRKIKFQIEKTVFKYCWNDTD